MDCYKAPREEREIETEVWRRRKRQWAESKVPPFLELPFLQAVGTQGTEWIVTVHSALAHPLEESSATF